MTVGRSTVDRRTLVLGGAAAAAGVAGLGFAIGRPLMARPSGATSAGTPVPGTLSPVSMAMHIHGSFSEGQASMAAHLAQAERLGVDVLWWTDHDWRVNAYGYRRAVRFDGMEELEDDLWWRWAEEREGPLDGGGGEFVSEPRSPDEPGSALRLTARGAGTLWYAGTAWNFTYRTSLAQTTIELDVFPETAQGRLVVELTASYHPSTGGRPAGRYVLRYEVDQAGRQGSRADGLVGIVEVPAPTGRWQRLTLRPVEDIAALWPDLEAADNSLFGIRIGISGGSAVVDRLRFIRTGRVGQEALALRDELIRGYAERYPGVIQRSALEVSLVRHLNWFGETVRLPDYGGRSPVLDRSLQSATAMVRFIQSQGGLACYNHPMQGEVGNPAALAKLLVAERALGCDLVEIGYPADLGKLLRVLDATARNAVLYTATGVTDDHAGDDWLNQKANYLTGVWAASTGTADLLDGLRAGRAWFADPKQWRGTLDLSYAGAPAMGGALVTSYPRVDLRVFATDLPAGAVLELVVGRVDLAGPDRPEPAIVRTTTVPARDVRGGAYELAVEPEDGAYVRAMIRGANGAVIGVGNPVWLLRRPPPAGIPPARRLTAQ